MSFKVVDVFLLFKRSIELGLLTLVHVVIHMCNKGEIYRSLKYGNFKTSKHTWKM